MTPEEEAEYLQREYGMTTQEAEIYALLDLMNRKEIAEKMGLKVDEVNKMVYAGHRKLHDNLDKAEEDGYIWVD